MGKDKDDMDDLVYLLGNMGIEILISIHKGAKNFETIKLFSGIPIECIRGRIPVLLGLQLIEKTNNEYVLTQKGVRFKDHLKKSNK